MLPWNSVFLILSAAKLEYSVFAEFCLKRYITHKRQNVKAVNEFCKKRNALEYYSVVQWDTVPEWMTVIILILIISNNNKKKVYYLADIVAEQFIKNITTHKPIINV